MLKRLVPKFHPDLSVFLKDIAENRTREAETDSTANIISFYYHHIAASFPFVVNVSFCQFMPAKTSIS